LAIRYWSAFGKLFDDITEDGYDVRALVLCSSFPNIFTAGLDCVFVAPLCLHTDSFSFHVVKETSILSSESVSPTKWDGARVSLAMHQFIQRFQTAITKPERAPFPVIAAVHGQIIGLGVDIMCACDVRYAAENSVFSIKVSLDVFALRELMYTRTHRRQILV